MSDTREALRRHFEIDTESIVIATLSALQREGSLSAAHVAEAIQSLDYDPKKLV